MISLKLSSGKKILATLWRILRAPLQFALYRICSLQDISFTFIYLYIDDEVDCFTCLQCIIYRVNISLDIFFRENIILWIFYLLQAQFLLLSKQLNIRVDFPFNRQVTNYTQKPLLTHYADVPYVSKRTPKDPPTTTREPPELIELNWIEIKNWRFIDNNSKSQLEFTNITATYKIHPDSTINVK